MENRYEIWSSAEAEELTRKLQKLAEPEYATFTCKLVPTSLPVFGVRVPKIRAIAKELKKSGRLEAYLDAPVVQQYEQELLHGLSLGLISCPFSELLERIRKFLPNIGDWAVCDMTVSGLKQFRKEENRKAGFAFACECIKSKSPWYYRFGVVLCLRYFLSDEYIHKILLLIEEAEWNEYYANMGTAWLLAEAYLTHPQAVLECIDRGRLSEWVVQKGLQKAIESRRITEDEREFLRQKKKEKRNR